MKTEVTCVVKLKFSEVNRMGYTLFGKVDAVEEFMLLQDGWHDCRKEQPKESGHYEVINYRGVRGYDDYSTSKKIWWNFKVSWWR